MENLQNQNQDDKNNESYDDIFLELHDTKNLKRKIVKTNKDTFIDKINNWLVLNSPIKFEDKLLFFQLLAVINNSGIPLNEGLGLLEDQTIDPHLKLVINRIKKDVTDGKSLSEAFGFHPDIFDEATCSILTAGESSGNLTLVLKQLTSQYEQINKIQKKVKGLMIYPIVVICIMILAVVASLLFIIPKLEKIFEGSASLPLPTRIMVASSDFLIEEWPILLLVLGFVSISLWLWKRTENGKKTISQIFLSTPGVGSFIKKLVLSRFTRLMGFLISSGVPVLSSLRISATAVDNEIYREKFLLAGEDLQEGIELSENFRGDPDLFPPLLVEMINIGERTSSMSETMGKLAEYYDEELDRGITNLSKLIEPVIMVIMAVGVVFLILAIYLPILQISDQVSGG